MEELHKWVAAARAHKGWTQTQLGDELGVTKANVSGWENARHEPSYTQIARISQLTGYAMPGQTAALPVSLSDEALDIAHMLDRISDPQIRARAVAEATSLAARALREASAAQTSAPAVHSPTNKHPVRS